MRLVYADGSQHEIPEEQSQATYYIKKSQLADGRALHDIFQSAVIPDVGEGETAHVEIPIIPPQTMTPPDELAFPRGILMEIRTNVVGVMSHIIKGNVGVEPNTFIVPVIYTNALTGASLEFDVTTLPVGVKRVEAGKFYFQMHPLNYYYCEAVNGSKVTWKLIESFQSGDLIRATTTQDISYSYHYIEVTDKRILERMRARLKAFNALDSRRPRPPFSR